MQIFRLLVVSSLALLIPAVVSLSTFGDSGTRERTDSNRSIEVREASVEDLREILDGRLRGEDRKRITRSHRPARLDFVIPVAGVDHRNLRDSFGDPRSGGRHHLGIDIMAPRWTRAIATVDGRIASITTGSRSGKALWIAGRDGRSYFYAHLEDWAEGVREGTRVRAGDLVGYVGNSGNAIHTPPHLHFEIRERRGVVNPYVELARAQSVEDSDVRIADAENESTGRRSLWEILFGRRR